MAVVRNSIKEQVYREIKTRILNREYPPGSILNIVHLSREFEVSNSPIREALAMLEKENLVEAAVNAKFQVARLDNEKLQELNAAMVTLLSGAVMLADRQGRIPAMAESLEKCFKKQESCSPDADPEEKSRLALEFDRTIIAVTGNRLLLNAFDNWYNLMLLSSSLLDGISGDSLREHRRILDALRSGDILRALRALELHYDKRLAEPDC